MPDVPAKLTRIPLADIAITTAAFEAIAATLPLGSVGFERELDDNGERLI
jgi:hypothetical protein